MTYKSIGLNDKGYGRILEMTLISQIKLQQLLSNTDAGIRINPVSDSNIVCFFVSQTRLGWEAYEAYLDDFTKSWNAKKDSDHSTLIRCVIMNPFFMTKEGDTDYAEEFVKSVLVKIDDLEQKQTINY